MQMCCTENVSSTVRVKKKEVFIHDTHKCIIYIYIYTYKMGLDMHVGVNMHNYMLSSLS